MSDQLPYLNFLQAQAPQSTMKAVQIKDGKGPESLYVGVVALPAPQQGEVLIKVKATAINRADTLQVFFRTLLIR